MNNRKKYHKIFVITLIAVSVLLFFVWGSKELKNKPTVTLQINNTSFVVFIADTYSKRVIGLSGKRRIDPLAGMFFVFDRPGVHDIWMKNMHFSIDIAWFDEDLIIIDLKSNISPNSYPIIFTPKKNAKYALEVNAGVFEKEIILEGDRAILKVQ